MSWSTLGMDASAARVEVMTQAEAAEAFGIGLAETDSGEECLVLTFGSTACFLDGTRSDFVVLAGRIITACGVPM